MILALDLTSPLVTSIPGVLPSWPAVEFGGTPIDADYRKRIIEAVLEFRARQESTTTKEEI